MQGVVLLHIGVEFARKGDLRQAERAFRAAIKVNPDYARAHSHLGHILNQVGRTGEAEAYLCESIRLDPGLPDAYNNLGLLLLDANRLEEAEACLRKAISLDPDSAVLYNNLGLVLEDAGDRCEAEKLYRQAIGLKDDYSDAYYNLANFLKREKRLDEAECCYHRALKLQPKFPLARFALSTLYLLRGQFDNGWKSYNELRMMKARDQLDNIPYWRGESLAGRSILLFHEQGLGDTLQFVRYASKVVAAAAKTVLWVQKPLQRLITTSFPGLSVYAGEARPEGSFDFSCPLPDLPMLFDATEKTIPRTAPYLQAATEIADNWQAILRESGDTRLYRVGIVWAGNPKHHNDRNRSIPFSIFSSLFTTDGIGWVSLQVGSQAEAIREKRLNIADFSGKLTDFAETAGLIKNLDLVITVDSSVAHLAGALGKRTWILLPFAPDWRWQLEREDCPWYPSVRLFRQSQPKDWPEVLQRVKKALGNTIKGVWDDEEAWFD